MRSNLVACGAALLLAACGTTITNGVTPAPGSPATDVPGRFEPSGQYARVAPADTISGDDCTSPMTDPRTGEQIVMRRAARGIADYEVPVGRYGVQSGEYLRLDCNSGRVLGIVKR